jgi:hypothetical protein
MRQKRAKTYKKYMNMYSTVFGFREPYQVIGSYPLVPLQFKLIYFDSVDSEMCRVALSYRLDLAHQFQIVLQGQVKPSETLCEFTLLRLT